jgi:hypothetical protein
LQISAQNSNTLGPNIQLTKIEAVGMHVNASEHVSVASPSIRGVALSHQNFSVNDVVAFEDI